MALKEQRIIIRGGTLSEWDAVNPILRKHEIAFISDLYKFKVGDGGTLFNDLPLVDDLSGIEQDIIDLNNSKVDKNDSRLTNSREWTASTISQAEAENGTATTRRAFTAQRVRQAIAAWWNSLDIIGKGDSQVPTNQDIREKYDVQPLISVEPTLSLDFSKSNYTIYEP